jgi:virginiamycin A acetyltransferase
MKNGKKPDPNVVYPIAGYEKEIYVKPMVQNPNIVVGDFTYIADSDFDSHVTHFYPWSRDKLIIGKFCQIASGTEFVMNDANHQMNAVSTFPFYTLEGWEMEPPAPSDLPFKGDTVIGNDVWIGQNTVILPGVRIGDGAIIGATSVVGSNVDPYNIVIGNPARVLRKRFDDELIGLLLKFRWWDRSTEEINSLIPILTCSDLEKVREELEARLSVKRTGLDKECRALERIIDRLSGGEETVEIADKFYTPENALEYLRGFLQELKTLNAQIAEHGNTEELLKIVQEKYSELWVFALSFTIKSLPGVIDGLRRYPGTDDD